MKFLRVKTDSKLIVYEDVQDEYKLLGGRNLIAKLLLDEVDPKCDALGPDNKLIICGGLLNGTMAPCCGRLSIGGKSPLTGTIKESNAGGVAARMLFKLGLKAIIIENKPNHNEWFILKISKDEAELLPADKYVGMNNYALAEQLRKEFGEKIGIISIGGAGEKGYRNSSIQITDMSGNPCRAAARGGLGAVMGSKGIKAVVLDVSGPLNAQYLDKEKFRKAVKNYIKGIKAHPVSGGVLPKYGTAALVNLTNSLGILPTNNFSDGKWDKADNVSGEKLADIQSTRGGRKGHTCHPGCVIGCSNVINDENGKYLTSGFEYETIAVNGPNCGISSLDIIAKIDRLCDDFGLDTIETGCTIGVCMEAGKLEFGDGEGALKLIQEMMDGTDFGKILGQGTEFVGKYLGVKRIPTVKGQSFAGYDPRGIKGMGVTYATSPMGADHTAGVTLGDPTVDPCKKEGQVELSTKKQVIAAMLDSLGMCVFAGDCLADPVNIGYLCEMMAAKFGGEWDEDKLFDIGVQTLILEKSFNKESGITPRDNRLPDFMYDEVLPSTGTVFDLTDEELEKAISF